MSIGGTSEVQKYVDAWVAEGLRPVVPGFDDIWHGEAYQMRRSTAKYCAESILRDEVGATQSEFEEIKFHTAA